MIDRKALKERAKAYAFDHKWVIWKPMVIVALIIVGASMVVGVIAGLIGVNDTVSKVISALVGLATFPLTFGVTNYLMKTIHGQTVDLMECLKKKYKIFIPLFLVTLFAGFLIGLASLLLVVPGIILSLRYAMVEFIASEAEESFSAFDVMKRSAKMMDGHKWDYFVFGLSFIGWMLLVEVTFGIAAIWVIPYITTAEIYYYDELKKLEK